MWRGYMLEKVKHLPLWKQSVIIGSIWGVWHAPMIALFGHNFPGLPILGIFIMMAFTIALTPIMIIIRNRSNSIYTVAVFHGTINAVAGTILILFSGTREIIVGMQGASGIIALLLINSTLYIWCRRKMSSKEV